MNKSWLVALFLSFLFLVYAEKPSVLSPEQEAKAKTSGQKFKFETEVSRMMKLIINSLYKSKEIFLKELISNASDALDKIRFMSLMDKEILGENTALNITIFANKQDKTLVITDSGVGMTKDELVTHLGTIAKSGTSEFLKTMENNKTADVGLIGQFGVGFYSVFLVADSVTVISKNNNDNQYIWESTSENDFSISEDPRGNTLGRGTQIIIHLKPNAEEYLDESKLKSVINKHSEFIGFPIHLWTTKTETEEVPDEEEQEEKDEDAEVEDVDETKKPKTKTITKTVEGWERLNENKPLWTRDPKEVSDEDHKSFYKAFTKDFGEPLAWTHFRAEGDYDFRSIVYIPERAPSQFLQKRDDKLNNFKLFVRKVFITDELTDLVPHYLSFLKGLLDSDDLPLNVSRETLQQNSILRLIKKKLMSKIMEMFKTLSKDAEKYEKFIKEYGVALKLGVVEDSANRKKLSKLIRFKSSHSDKLTGLDDYVERMKKGQPQIYIATGSDMDEIKRSPFTEKLVARGYEVIFMSDPIDEYVVQSLSTFGGKKLQNIAKSGLQYGDEDEETKKVDEELATKFKPLVEYFQSSLSEFIDKAVVSNLLTKSPCAVVASEHGITGTMEKIMQAQALGNGGEDFLRQYYLKQKKILEINPGHPIIKGLLKKVESGSADDKTKETVRVLYETTLLTSGYQVPNTMDFAKRIEKVIRDALNVDLEEEANVEIKPAPEGKNEPKEEKEEEDEEKEDGDGHDEL